MTIRIVLLLISIFIHGLIYGQRSYNNLMLTVKIDSIKTTGIWQVYLNLPDTTTTPYCRRIIYFTLNILNQANERIQLVDDSYKSDFRTELFDFELERYDTLKKAFIPLQGDLSNPVWSDKGRNLYINGGDTLQFSHQYSYGTRINEKNRIRVILRLPIDDFKKYKKYSDWFEIEWDGMEIIVN